MKIALIDPSLFTWPYDSELACALQGAGHEVLIFGKSIAAKEAGPALALLRPHFYTGLERGVVASLPKPAFLALKGFSHISALFGLWRFLARWQPDIIHFQWAPLPAVDRWFVPQFRKIAPTLLTVHDSSPFNNAPSSRLQLLGAKSIWGQFDHLIVHTQRAIDTLTTCGVPRGRISQLAHGPLGGAGSTVKVRRKPAGPGSPVRILLFGRIRHYKGPDILLRAAAALPRETLARCRIRIVGEPHMSFDSLHRIVEDAGMGEFVKLEPRYIPEAELGEVLSAADLIVLPYREIDASGVLMMCLAAGVPIVASRIGLFAEMLSDGVHGRLTPVEDHLALSAALAQLIEDPGLRDSMGEAVRKLRASIPDWPEIAQSTVSLYGSLRHKDSSCPQAPSGAKTNAIG